jgi:putative hydrolase of HD superfamily
MTENAVDDAPALHAFLRATSALKDTLRNTRTASERQESTAEHSWRLALMGLVLAPPELDRLKVLALCLTHDLPEAIGGDTPAATLPDKAAKAAAERADLAALLAPAPSAVRAEIMALWEEYETAATPEARFVKALDKIETVMAHAEGAQPPGFDWRFNLDYGKALAQAWPTLAALRALADADTAARAAEHEQGE